MNKLTKLNLDNGNNHKMKGVDFDITGNPNLTCVLVFDIMDLKNEWTNKDANTVYILNCY